MTGQPETESTLQPYTLRDDEKIANIMAYTTSAIHWGVIVVKNLIRVSTWLRTNLAPEVLTIYNARTLSANNSSALKPVTSKELYLFANQILGFHLLPPQEEPPDYDTTEPNRYMDPVTILIGPIRIDGHMRLSLLSNVEKYLDVNREEFTSIYNAEISNTLAPSSGVMKIPYLLVRQNGVVFTKKYTK